MLKRLILIDLAVMFAGLVLGVAVSSDAGAVVIVIAGFVLIVLLVVAGVRRLVARGGSLPLRNRDLWFAVGGVILLAIAIPMAFDDRWLAAATVAFGVGLLAMPVAERLGGGGGRTQAKLQDGAVVIDSLRAKVWAGRLVLTIAGVAGAVYFVVSESADRWIGLFMAVCFAITMFEHVRKRTGRQRIVIDAGGLAWQAGRDRRRFGWDELTGVDSYDLQHTHYLSVGDLPLESFPVHANTLAKALRTWATKPELREELGTPAAVARLRSAREARQPVELQPDEVREHR